MPPLRRLRRRELPAATLELAEFLLGKVLVHDAPPGRVSGRIVEVEAYHQNDRASHTHRGRTPRNAVMFGTRGFAYVYFTYGAHFCVNVSSEARGVGAAVLLRALEPLEGSALMRARRGAVAERDLARGPGRLTQALAIDRRLDGSDLCGPGALWLGSDGAGAAAVARSVRIGISRDIDLPWRFFVAGNRYVSGPSRLNRVERSA